MEVSRGAGKYILLLLLVAPFITGQPPADYRIGLTALVDYALWTAVLEEAGSPENTRVAIQYYFTHLIKETNERMESLDNAQYTLRIVLENLVIAEDAASAAWSETGKISVPGGRDQVMAGDILDRLEDLLTNTYTSADHVMGFTGYDLVGGTTTDNKIGLARLSGLCDSTNSVSVIEDRGNYLSSITIAHELGHSMSAIHDGDNMCSQDSQFIMAAVVEVSIDMSAGTWPYSEFSVCSMMEIGTFLDGLGDPGNNPSCLNDQPANAIPAADMTIFLSILPGQALNVDGQCELMYGEGAIYRVCDATNLGFSTITCNQLQCLQGNQCFRTFMPFTGSSCGDGEWCIRGQCVADADAPPLNEACPLGDRDRDFCGAIVASSCYNERTVALCCGSCASFRNDATPNCLYGDRASNCGTLQNFCTVASVSETCCATCPTTPPGPAPPPPPGPPPGPAPPPPPAPPSGSAAPLVWPLTPLLPLALFLFLRLVYQYL